MNAYIIAFLFCVIFIRMILAEKKIRTLSAQKKAKLVYMHNLHHGANLQRGCIFALRVHFDHVNGDLRKCT